jgi:hypothetical protein
MSGIVKQIFNLFNTVFWIGLFLLFILMTGILGDYVNEENDLDEYTDVTVDSLKNELDSIMIKILEDERIKREKELSERAAVGCTVIKKKYEWENLSGKKFSISFPFCEEDLQASEDYRNTLDSYSSVLYEQLHTHDSSRVSTILAAFKNLKTKHKLNRSELMEAIVTFIQSIPYTYILEPGRDCGSTVINSKGVAHSFPPYNCKPAIPAGCCDQVKPWGIFSPVEFLINETGDCDTRSLLAYTILEKFGYDIAVVNSDKMGHSMLGVSVPFVPGNGNYGLTAIKRKRYYLWELTAMGLHLGDNYDFYSNDWLVTYR